MAIVLRVCLASVVCASVAHADVVYQNAFDIQPGDEWSNTKVSSIASPWGSFLGNFGQETVRLTLGRGPGGGNPGGGGQPGGGSQPGAGPIVLGGDVGRPGGGSGGPGSGTRGRNGRVIASASGLYGGSGGPGGGNGGGDGGGGNGGGDPGVDAGEYSLFFDLYLFDTWDGRDPTYGTDRFKVAVNGVVLFNEILETFEPWENDLDGWEIPGNHAFNGQYRDLIYRGLEIRFSVADPGSLLEIDFISGSNQPLADESWGLDNVRIVRHARAVPAGPTGLVLLGGALVAARRRR